MSSGEYRRLIDEILRNRRIGWTDVTKHLMRLMVRAALENGQLTQEQHEYLMKMLDDDDYTPPPPGDDDVPPPPGDDDVPSSPGNDDVRTPGGGTTIKPPKKDSP